jgi:hypothetical protein
MPAKRRNKDDLWGSYDKEAEGNRFSYLGLDWG